MLCVSGTQQDHTSTIQEVPTPQAHGKLLIQQLIAFFVRKKQDDPKELQPIPESPIEIFQQDERKDFKWETMSYDAFTDFLRESDIPILIIFYSSKVSLSYYDLSNEQSERCDGIFQPVQKLVEESVPDKVRLVKYDIERHNFENPLEMSHVPTIKLYPGLKTKKKYPVEYFDDPLDESNYERFLKEEGVIGS